MSLIIVYRIVAQIAPVENVTVQYTGAYRYVFVLRRDPGAELQLERENATSGVAAYERDAIRGKRARRNRLFGVKRGNPLAFARLPQTRDPVCGRGKDQLPVRAKSAHADRPTRTFVQRCQAARF